MIWVCFLQRWPGFAFCNDDLGLLSAMMIWVCFLKWWSKGSPLLRSGFGMMIKGIYSTLIIRICFLQWWSKGTALLRSSFAFTIPTPPCHTVRLADLLADEEITRARDGYIVIGPEGIILNLSGIICKVVWLAERYFPSLLKSKFYQFLGITLDHVETLIKTFKIHLMRSCSTNLNISCLTLLESALTCMRWSRMPLV